MQLVVLSGAVMMLKYLEDSSPNVLALLDLCIWIKAMPLRIVAQLEVSAEY